MANGHDKLRVQTLGEWRDLYLDSDDCPQSAKRNLPGIFHRFASLVSDSTDPYTVSIWEAAGLLQAFQQDIQQRLAKGELREASAKNYLSWGTRAIYWAVEHILGRDAHTQPTLLIALDPHRHQLLTWLKRNRPKIEGQEVRQFFQWMDEEGIAFKRLATESEELTRRFAFESLEASGIKTWRQSYATARRGLVKLRKAGLLPEFPLFSLSRTFTRYQLNWHDIPNDELQGRAATYYRVACDESAFDERTGRVVRTTTRDNRLNVLGRFAGFLFNEAGIDISKMTIDEIFSRHNLKSFVAFLTSRQSGQTTGGVKSTLNQLRQFATSFLDIPKERFGGLVDPKSVVHKRKSDRIPTLDEFHTLLSRLHEIARSRAHHRTPEDQAFVYRLHCILKVMGACPIRIGTLCRLRIDKNLIKDPMTDAWEIHLSADEVKNKRNAVYPLSDTTQTVLNHYLEYARNTILQGNDSDYLFPTRTGKPIEQTFVNKQIIEWDTRIREVPVGRAISPHRIRDMVSETCITYLPQQGSLVAQTLLQHAQIRTLDKHYLGEVGRSAIQRNERLNRLIDKDEIGEDDVRKILAEVRRDENEWRRFRKAIEFQS